MSDQGDKAPLPPPHGRPSVSASAASSTSLLSCPSSFSSTSGPYSHNRSRSSPLISFSRDPSEPRSSVPSLHSRHNSATLPWGSQQHEPETDLRLNARSDSSTPPIPGQSPYRRNRMSMYLLGSTPAPDFSRDTPPLSTPSRPHSRSSSVVSVSGLDSAVRSGGHSRSASHSGLVSPRKQSLGTGLAGLGTGLASGFEVSESGIAIPPRNNHARSASQSSAASFSLHLQPQQQHAQARTPMLPPASPLPSSVPASVPASPLPASPGQLQTRLYGGESFEWAAIAPAPVQRTDSRPDIKADARQKSLPTIPQGAYAYANLSAQNLTIAHPSARGSQCDLASTVSSGSTPSLPGPVHGGESGAKHVNVLQAPPLLRPTLTLSEVEKQSRQPVMNNVWLDKPPKPPASPRPDLGARKPSRTVAPNTPSRGHHRKHSSVASSDFASSSGKPESTPQSASSKSSALRRLLGMSPRKPPQSPALSSPGISPKLVSPSRASSSRSSLATTPQPPKRMSSAPLGSTGLLGPPLQAVPAAPRSPSRAQSAGTARAKAKGLDAPFAYTPAPRPQSMMLLSTSNASSPRVPSTGSTAFTSPGPAPSRPARPSEPLNIPDLVDITAQQKVSVSSKRHSSYFPLSQPSSGAASRTPLGLNASSINLGAADTRQRCFSDLSVGSSNGSGPSNESHSSAVSDPHDHFSPRVSVQGDMDPLHERLVVDVKQVLPQTDNWI